MAQEETNISQITDKEIAELMSMGGPENVITQEESDKNPLRRQNDEIELSLVPEKTELIEEDKNIIVNNKVLDDVLKLDEPIEEESDIKTEKNSLLEAFEDLVKDETIFLFEDEKPLKEYSKKELIELIKANQTRVKEEESAKAPAELFDSMPSQMQYAINYLANGGTNLQGLFKHLSQSEEVANLDITTENGQEQTIRKFLTVSGLGTAEEIEEEINSLKDMPGALEKKANQYKPKLEAKQQQLIDKELKDQELRKIQQEKAAVKYREDIVNALTPGDLDGIKITPTIQGMLFNGLTQATYPSVSGRNTNLFGHLIEKYNYVEPNPKLIAKALWLLKDPKGFEEAIKASANTEMVADTVKKLKTAANEKTTHNNQEVIQTNKVRKTIPKQKANIFART